MSTLLKNQGFCGYCGKLEAPMLCACKGENYCSKDCQKAAWAEHRLRCSAMGAGNSSIDNDPKLRQGDIVKISGLQTAQGHHANGRLAEVQSFDKEKQRYSVLYATGEFQVKAASLKATNLEIQLSAKEAAHKAANKKRPKLNEDEQSSYMHDAKKEQNNVRSLSGNEIMKRLKSQDEKKAGIFLQALQLGGQNPVHLTERQKKEMLEHGLIDFCMQQFKFPEMLDEPGPMPINATLLLQELANALTKDGLGMRPHDQQLINRYRVETCQKMSHLILLASNKKFRFYQDTALWVGLQSAFSSLLSNMAMAEALVTRVMLNELDPLVTTALLNHILFMMSVDPTLYLRTKSIMTKKNSLVKDGSMGALIKMTTLQALMELCDLGNNIPEAAVTRIGMLKVPAGAKHLAGSIFASCFFEVAAVVIVEVMSHENTKQRGMHVVEELQYMFSCFWRCSRLVPIMPAFDNEFAYELTNPSAAMRWARKKLKD